MRFYIGDIVHVYWVLREQAEANLTKPDEPCVYQGMMVKILDFNDADKTIIGQHASGYRVTLYPKQVELIERTFVNNIHNFIMQIFEKNFEWK